MEIAAVIVAAGYGSFRRGEDGSMIPKVVEQIDGVSAVARVVRSVAAAGFKERVVVVNPRSQDSIASVLAAHGFKDRFVVQPCRNGSAHAVQCALPFLSGLGVEQVFVVYADMPLWRPETIRALAELHARERATLFMATVSLRREHSEELERYGRILRDHRGGIARVVECADSSEDEIAASDAVNPSLWIWEREWLAERIGTVPAVPKSDGHDPERYLPPLVGRAYREGRRIAELELCDPTEALGVNTPSELERVRATFALRRAAGIR